MLDHTRLQVASRYGKVKAVTKLVFFTVEHTAIKLTFIIRIISHVRMHKYDHT